VNKRDLAAIFNHGWLGSHASPCRTLNQTVGARSIFFWHNETYQYQYQRQDAKPRSQAKCCFHCKACHICINAMTNLVDYNNPVATALLLPLTTDFSFGIP
tara:strand:- start:285 stop:587 length:303 start_codon:yes stop_codon:yes gene_type:complete